jgi:hypothetical protein
MIRVTSSSSSEYEEPLIIKERVPAYWVILTKCVSGRFLLTVSASVCFLIIVEKLMKILLSKADELDSGQLLLLISNLALVIQNVFNSYFSKRKPEENGNSNG